MFKPVRQAEIAKYQFVLDQLQQMLDSEDGYSEACRRGGRADDRDLRGRT